MGAHGDDGTDGVCGTEGEGVLGVTGTSGGTTGGMTIHGVSGSGIRSRGISVSLSGTTGGVMMSVHPVLPTFSVAGPGVVNRASSHIVTLPRLSVEINL